MRKDLFLGKSFQVYGPDSTAMACEACVYGRGAHESWCPFSDPNYPPLVLPNPGGKCCDDDDIRAGGCN